MRGTFVRSLISRAGYPKESGWVIWVNRLVVVMFSSVSVVMRPNGRFSFAAIVSLYLEGLLFEDAGVTVHEVSKRPELFFV